MSRIHVAYASKQWATEENAEATAGQLPEDTVFGGRLSQEPSYFIERAIRAAASHAL